MHEYLNIKASVGNTCFAAVKNPPTDLPVSVGEVQQEWPNEPGFRLGNIFLTFGTQAAYMPAAAARRIADALNEAATLAEAYKAPMKRWEVVVAGKVAYNCISSTTKPTIRTKRGTK
jgi:hypothetical protein